jgi:hypothetical protein
MIRSVIDDVRHDIAKLRALIIAGQILVLDPRAKVAILGQTPPGLVEGRDELRERDVFNLLDVESASLKPNTLSVQNVLEDLKGSFAIFESPNRMDPLLVGPQVILEPPQ